MGVYNKFWWVWIDRNSSDSLVWYVNGNKRRPSYNVIYFDSFGAEDIPKEIEKFIGNQNIITNIYRIKACNLIMCGCFCIGYIDFMLKVKCKYIFS